MVSENALMRIDEIADENLLATVEGGKMSRAIAVADRMQELRKLLSDDVLKGVSSLQGTDIGFRTDKDGKGGYKIDVIRDVTIEATLRGYSMTGNEVNIIANRFYATRNGLERKVREFPGLTDLKLKAGVPQKMSEGALVEYHASWKLNGQPDEIKCEQHLASDTRIAVRVNAGMGIDAILGKAERKMLARIYKRLTGSAQSVCVGETEAEPEEIQAVEVVEETPAIDDREAAIIAAKERIDACQTPREVADAVTSSSQGMDPGDVDEIADYGIRRSKALGKQ